MKKYISRIGIYGGFILSLFTTPLFAQEYSDLTPAALEKINLNNVWQKTSNAAGAVWSETPKYSYVDAGYEYYNGNFHRPQQGADGNSLHFKSEGNLILNKTRVWGFFSYNRDNINGTQFNSSIIDPYRGMPYYVADTVMSNWKNQHYNMAFRVAYPLSAHLAIGLEGRYQADLGAKQMDSRTLNRQMTLTLKPSAVYSLNEHHHFGASFEYYSLKEESEMSNVNANVDQTYYKLYGLGTAVIGLGSGRSTDYVGNNVGGALQYQYRGNVNILLEGSYNLKVEDVRVSFSTPQDDSSVRDNIWKGSAVFIKDGKFFLNSLSLIYINRRIDGIQYITKYDNTTSQQGWQTLYSNVRSKYNTDNLSAIYTLMKKRHNEYSWLANASVSYQNEKDVYLMPYSDKKAENLKIGLGGKINSSLSNKLSKRLLTGIDLFYNKNLSGEYNYQGSHADYPVVTKFETVDLNYLITNYYGINLSAVYSQRIKEDLKADIYIKANYKYTKAKDFEFNHRSIIEFSIGSSF